MLLDMRRRGMSLVRLVSKQMFPSFVVGWHLESLVRVANTQGCGNGGTLSTVGVLVALMIHKSSWHANCDGGHPRWA